MSKHTHRRKQVAEVLLFCSAQSSLCSYALVRALPQTHTYKQIHTGTKNDPQFIQLRLHVPRQNNYCDCGLFVLTFMEFFCHDAPDVMPRAFIQGESVDGASSGCGAVSLVIALLLHVGVCCSCWSTFARSCECVLL